MENGHCQKFHDMELIYNNYDGNLKLRDRFHISMVSGWMTAYLVTLSLTLVLLLIQCFFSQRSLYITGPIVYNCLPCLVLIIMYICFVETSYA